MPEFRTVTVKILGQEYKIRSSESAEFVEAVARYADEVLRGVSARMNTVTPVQVAVLGALNIAEELLRERRDGRNGDGEVHARLRALLARLEEIEGSDGAARKRGRVAVRAGARG